MPTVGRLDSYFTNLITDLMAVERQPLDRLQQKRDSITVQRAIYTDLKTRLDELHSQAKSLRSGNDSYALAQARRATISGAPNGASVASASASSSAEIGTYSLYVETLARAHRLSSDRQVVASGQDLNLAGTFSLNGVEISVEATDSLEEIAARINAAVYAQGSAVVASVIDQRLVLSSQDTGAGQAITAVDQGTHSVLKTLGILDDLGGLKNELQGPADAVFYLNNLKVTRSENTDLQDVLSGVSLSLAADAEGKTVTLTVAADTSSARAALDSFVTKFNNLQSYLEQKTAITKDLEGNYQRAPLANDNSFNNLRSQLFFLFSSDVDSPGTLKSLRSIGLILDDNLKASVSDASKLDEALLSDLENVTGLLDTLMDGFDVLLGRFTGTSGYVDTLVKSADEQNTSLNNQIQDLNERLVDKEESLNRQFAEMQAQLLQLSYMQQTWSNIYNTTNRLY